MWCDDVTVPTIIHQVDQLRSELMQERSERHDLEMDKSALERQVPLPLQVNDAHTSVHLYTGENGSG